MRVYNLFVIKDEYINYYKNKPNELYNILYSLSNLKYNFNYGISLYEQLCNRIDIKTLRNYFNDKYELNNERTFYINKIFIELKHSRVVIKSKYNYPRVLKALNCYNRNIFICDFINKDYFWLSGFIRNNVLQHI